ncbi:Mu transposase domain-containing protein [Escherichia coli]
MSGVGGNRYSVLEALCGQLVSIRISLDDELRIYSNEKLVDSHCLCSASSGCQSGASADKCIQRAIYH